MSYYIIHTYNSIEQLRQIQREKEIVPFIFAETKDLLEEDPNLCIDISALICLLRANEENRYSAYINLREITEETIVIIEESIADDAINFFPHLFSSYIPFYQEKNVQDCEALTVTFKNTRQPIYTYNSVNDLTSIITYANAHNIPLSTFSRASGHLKNELEKFNKSAEMILLDLTSTAYAIEDNKNLIYTVELFMNTFPNIKIIALTSQIDKIIKYFPLYIEDQQSIDILLPDLKELMQIDTTAEEIKKVISLSNAEFATFIEGFNHNLVGHDYFKERFKYYLKNFISLNKVKEQKVLSIFLFGASGIGKTEVARLIANMLQKDGYLAKINFQNYSSQDALNSLIGSPAGYIGCEHGELSDKVKKSKVGIVLCDEFEKTTRPVFSFFLELLEEGKFTDSMAREYDLDGYILVFTSNLPNEAEYKKIMPPELQTRFDLVCEFQEPSYHDKTKFLDLLLEQAENKFSEQFSQVQMTLEEKRNLYDFDYSSLNALRDIKRLFNNRLMDFFSEKGL